MNCIIIPVFNRKHYTLRCLEELTSTHGVAEKDIFVVDDGSTDGTAEEIGEKFPQANVLPGDGNLWWTGAMELGMRHCYDQGYETFMWLNDDTYLEKGAIDKCIELCEREQAVVTGMTYESDTGELIHGGAHADAFRHKNDTLIREDEITGEYVECDMAHGNIVCFPRIVLKDIGFPDGVNFHQGPGDIEYTLRVTRGGHRVLCSKDVIAHTKRGDDPNYSRWTDPRFSAEDVLNFMTNKRHLAYLPTSYRFLTRHFGFKGFIAFLMRYSKRFLILLLKVAQLNIRKAS